MKARPDPDLSRYSRGRHLVALLLLCLAGIVAYLPSFGVPFLYDDLKEILGNPALNDLSDWRTIIGYNPARALLMLTFALDLHLWGPRTFPFHVENLAIHLLNGMLVYLLAERILSRRGERPTGRPGGLEAPSGWAPALAVALLFTVHPLFVEAVTYIASRSSSLCTLFYLAAFAAWVRFRDLQAEGNRAPARGWFLLALNGYLLSVFTKEEGVSLPAVLLAYDLLLAPRPGAAATGSAQGAGGGVEAPRAALPSQGWMLASAPFWGVLVLLFLARFYFYGSLLAEPQVYVRTVGENLLTALEVLVVYLRLLVAPYGLSIYHDYPTVSALRLETVLALLFHLALVGAALLSARRRPLFTFGVLWFYAALSPTSSFVPLKEAMAEHRMYLAGFGGLILVGALLVRLRDRFRLSPLLFGVVVAIPLAVVTFRYNGLWRDEVALWSRALEIAPHSGDAAYALGDAYARRGRLQEAEEAYQTARRNYEALKIDLNREYKLNYVDALNNLGLVYGRQGNLDLAMTYFRRALSQNVRYPQAWNNLGYAQVQKGLFFEASLSFEEALKIDPQSWLAHYHLGNLYYEHLSDPQRAAEHYRRLLELRPDMKESEQIKARLLELGF